MPSSILRFLALGLLLAATRTHAEEPLPPASVRFDSAAATDVPDFRRHVLPLLGRVGCNGRACHGSFQGQGGFRLSLFGYDFEADHKALLDGDDPRVDREHPLLSLILQKPTLEMEHEGGQRIKPDSWQYRLLRRWIETGAAAVAAQGAEFDRLEVLPARLNFSRPGETRQLAVTAHWSDGTREDVTCLCRFRTNDESVATVDDAGLVTVVAPGDTHVVAFYDNGVVPVPVVTPTSDLIGPRYPEVATPGPIDRLVVDKLRELGIVPSEVCGDAEFLRRASVDITGTLPTPDEIEAFLADSSEDKRTRKVDELLTRPTYAAWWTTKICDYTGNNPEQLGEGPFDGPRSAQQWYTWIFQRVSENRPYDEIVAGIVLGTSRPAGQPYDDYCHAMNRCYGDDSGNEFAAQPTLPHYWMRRNNRKPEQMAEGFAYAFLGVRLQCAQCHKHPFDQWTKRDYDEFAALFRRIKFGVAPESKGRFEEIQSEFKKNGKQNIDFRKEGARLIAEDRLIPWREVFVAPPPKPKGKAAAEAASSPETAKLVEPGRLLEGQRMDLSRYADPRQALVAWLRTDAESYFARALVNRVWAGYFQRGIVEPPDDLSRANPACNGPLLDYLTQAFVEHHFDLKWLHRTIATSRTYQLSWRPNSTNGLDERNFSRANPRRLPAEVTYNAFLQATAAAGQLATLQLDPQQLATGPAPKVKLPKANYALSVFGRPTRATSCDCERSSQPSLLQTLYLQNDSEMQALLERPDGWLQQVSKQRQAGDKLSAAAHKLQALESELAEVERQSAAAPAGKAQKAFDKRRGSLQREIGRLREQVGTFSAATPAGNEASSERGALVRQAYLRTVSRPPTDDELQRSLTYFAEAPSESVGLRDLLWALLNTKEFILNH